MLWEGTIVVQYVRIDVMGRDNCCPVRRYRCYGKGHFAVQYVRIIVMGRDNLLSST